MHDKDVDRTPALGNTPVGRVRLYLNLTTVGVAHLGGHVMFLSDKKPLRSPFGRFCPGTNLPGSSPWTPFTDSTCSLWLDPEKKTQKPKN
jgi:hypothetical protein